MKRDPLEVAWQIANRLENDETRKYAFMVINQMWQEREEEARLSALAVPASFTEDKPDTPEAQAARRQLYWIKGDA